MIYPNNELKGNWDAVVTLILLFTCMVTPYRIAFHDSDPPGWEITNTVIDVFFAIDIILSFNSAYYSDEYDLIENRFVIAKNYIFGWFWIDFLAIFPFERVFTGDGEQASSNNVNDMIRLARLGRLYKILRLVRLFRILKLGKSSRNILRMIKQYLKLGPGFSRLIIFIIVASMMCHIVTCIWITMA